MSLTSDDARQLRELHSPRLRPETRNFRDASRGTGAQWQKDPTPIQTPGRGRGENPFGRGRLASKDGKTAMSSSQHAAKRQKLDHSTSSRYFMTLPPSSERRTRSKLAQAISPSPPPLDHTTDAIVIEEDDTPDLNDSSSKPDTLTTSSPDPMDLISQNNAYSFDPSKPSPMHQFSVSLEETHESPTDGESTARLRYMNQVEDQHSPSRMYGASQSAKVPVTPTIETSPQRDGSPRKGKVKELTSLYEAANREHGVVRVIDLQKRRKDNMKPKQPLRKVAPLPITRQDPHATGPSGFVSGSGSSKGKAARRDVVCNLPLEVWSIGVDIPPHEATPEPRANLVWERGLIRVQHVNSSVIFELHIKKGSLGTLQYVDVKKSSSLKPLIQIHPLETATVKFSTSNGFKLGSTHDDGLLTFKFDSVANDWDEKLYYDLLSVLSSALVPKEKKSILDRAGAKAVWEAVTNAHDIRSTRGELESSSPGIRPRKAPDSVTKPRPRPKSRTEVASPADMTVRRSARLSGVEQQPFTPKPDPDEVILTYRSGIGSLNITNGDVSRLQPGEFLNDTLIEFGLKLWLADLHESNPELASQVHVFSSFFYKKLSTKIPEDGYNSVRKWTSRFDLFQKKYIIVPINENMHWYLAIIYFPEHTLLPRPVQVTNVSPRRSTRRLGVVIDDVKDSEQPKQALPPDPDPPPSAQTDSVSRSGLLTPDSSRAEDQRDEIDVERMVESRPPLSGPPAKQNDGPCVDEDMAVDDAAREDDSLTLLYPASSPHVQRAELPSSDHQDDLVYPASRSIGEDSRVQTPEIPPSTSNEKRDHGRRNATSPEISIVDDGASAGIIEQEGPPASRNVSEGSGIRTPGIPPTVFYGKSNHRRRNDTPSEVALVDNGAPVEIVIEEDVIMGDPDSEHEETAEHPKTYIFTFDSLSSKHPQAVKRLSKYLLMEAHDKKQLAEETLNEPKGMQAFVPRQDNYCDCGIYLLHFAKTFMKDPKLSSEIIQTRSSPQRGRRAPAPHEHWDKASVGSYRTELATRIDSMSEEWKRQRREQDAATKNQAEAAATAPQEQSSTDPTPAASAKADDDSDSEIEVLGSPTKKAPPKAASRRDSGLAESRKKGTTTRMRSG